MKETSIVITIEPPIPEAPDKSYARRRRLSQSESSTSSPTLDVLSSAPSCTVSLVPQWVNSLLSVAPFLTLSVGASCMRTIGEIRNQGFSILETMSPMLAKKRPEFQQRMRVIRKRVIDRKMSMEIDMTGTYCDEVLRPLYMYMMIIGLNHTFQQKWRRRMAVYNYTVILMLMCATVRKFSQIGVRSSKTDSVVPFTFQGAVFDPAVVLTVCNALFLFSGTSASFLLLKLQKQRQRVYQVLDCGLGKNRTVEHDKRHFHLNKFLVGLSFAFSMIMAVTHMLSKLGVISLPWTPHLINENWYFVPLEGYVIFIAQSSISMLAILFFQLCFILRMSIQKLIDEMVPSVREDCPLPEASLQQIHDVQVHYQEIFNGKSLIEDNFSFALFYTYGACIPILCLLSYIITRNIHADFAELLAIVIWIVHMVITLLLFSIPAFMVHEKGDKLLSACFKMYHETLCEERDLLVLAQMNFLAFQMHSTKLTLSAGNYFYMNRKILLSLFSAIFTYFLILMQFDGVQQGVPLSTLSSL